MHFTRENAKMRTIPPLNCAHLGDNGGEVGKSGSGQVGCFGEDRFPRDLPKMI
jgi:hypothetical protein